MNVFKTNQSPSGADVGVAPRRRSRLGIGRKVLMVAGVVTLSVPLMASPALADWGQYLDGGYGYVNSARTRVGACDTRADGLGVTTWYGTDNGTGGSVGDYNGSGSGCGEEGPDHGGRITHFHVCVGTTCGPERWIA